MGEVISEAYNTVGINGQISVKENIETKKHKFESKPGYFFDA
jgi:hypothetical protein